MSSRIMFADDNLDIRRLLQMTFTLFHPDATVELVESGHEAVKLVKSGGSFDVALLDYQMPPGNNGGIWAARKIKSLRPSLPVIFISAYTERAKIDDARQAGAVAYISKIAVVQEPAAVGILEQDWAGLQQIADGQNVWVFGGNIPN